MEGNDWNEILVWFEVQQGVVSMSQKSSIGYKRMSSGRRGSRPGGFLSRLPHSKRGDGERGTNITTHTISSKRYLMLFHEAENCNDIIDWVGTQRWIKTSGNSNGRGNIQFLIGSVDPSLL
ncbi:disease resistance protein RPP4-like [Cucumis melo var. makuwa]|uniref:Disease resistance protein RPP4-like n=1 Tax=Cucumis melo var. makuwa TaxID=1194695 RepID=A0A5A7TYC4_CUCMM|nr:disease resistance protein RPP4-like [Cucumis melo var. makuwa]TYK18308.1 disease resistance protein RPP4-like [Cucumis melo var. makuwa]